MRVGVDMDGVLHNWTEAVLAVLRREWGVDLFCEGDPPYWDWIPDNVKPEAWEWLWSSQGAIDRMFDGPAYEGATEALAAMRHRRHHVAIVTHRPQTARRATLRWLDRHGIEFDSLQFTPDHKKALWAPEVDVWLDDSSEVAQHAAAVGKPVLLWDRAYNRPEVEGVVHDEDKVVRVGAWAEALEELARLAEEAAKASGIPVRA